MTAWIAVQWLLLAAVLVPATVFLRLSSHGRAQFAFSIVLVFGYVWVLGEHLLNVLPRGGDDGLYRASLYICYAGMCALGPSCVYLAWCYAGKHRLYRSLRKRTALFGTGAAFYLIVLTNDAHHLYYTFFSFSERSYGAAFYLFTVFSYACFGYAYIAMQRFRVDMGERAPVLFCFLPPVAANTADMFPHAPEFDFAPAGYCFMVLAAYLIVWRQRPVFLAPAAARQIFEDMAYPVLVQDPSGGVLWQNGAGKQGGRVYQAFETALYDGNALRLLTDVTDYDDARARLSEQQKALEQVHARLDEQARQIAEQGRLSARLAKGREHMKISAALDAEARGKLEALRSNIAKTAGRPEADSVEACKRIARETLFIVRRVVGSFPMGAEEPRDGL